MRTHRRVCHIPDLPDHNPSVSPHWLQLHTCTVVLLPLHSAPSHHPVASLTTSPLHLSSILSVFQSDRGPSRPHLLGLGLGWCLNIERPAQVAGFTLSEKEARCEIWTN
ncbi:hypothetical protein LDENG_00213110 [Lucifuga dentata]|nr:hypothetical protein LDENG_00213110 [Lucifuga dentata]